MKNYILLFALLLGFININAQNLKPYILAGKSSQSITEVQKTIKEKLTSSGLTVVGSYNPISSKDRVIIAFTSDELKSAAKKIGGYKGFGLALRVALTVENGKTLISYNNPEYWGRAYYMDKWDQVASYYSKLSTKLKTALSGFDDNNFTEFGSQKGVSISDLKKYHYMMGMPYFDDNVKIKEFPSFEVAISTIENNLKSGNSDFKKVYDITLNGEKMALFGVALTGKDGEKLFMPKIDISSPKHTAFLPYELLVVGNKAYMLHGRFRIALSFPDLTMGQFMKIVSTPGYIEDKMKEVCK